MKISQNKWPLILMSLALLAVVVFGVIACFNTARSMACKPKMSEKDLSSVATELEKLGKEMK